MLLPRFILASALVLLGFLLEAEAKDWEGAPYRWLYSVALTIPPVKMPVRSVINPVTRKPIDYYEIDILPFQKQIYPGKRAASMVGYDGMSPGPTFVIEKGRETVVRFTNKARSDSSIHLHGSYSRAPWDGWAEDKIAPGQYKDYYWPNSQSARFSWYHDHAIDHTAENAYFGQAGGYIVRDPAEDSLNLPSGYGRYDIPLIIESKQYREDGTLLSPAGERDSLYGDVIHVNGQPWPFFKVEPRKYRFRLLNAAVSRSFILYLRRQSGGSNIPFQVIASDTGLLTSPVTSSTLAISMAERYDIVVDFAPFAGQNLTLRNQEDVGKDDDYKETVNVMRFIVDRTAVRDTSSVPSRLRNIPPNPPSNGQVAHRFRFNRSNSKWTINDVGFRDARNRVLANVPRGTVQIWELENSSGGWTHPIHVHLVDFKVLSRRGGKRGVLPYESAGFKDVVWLDAGETVRVESWYAPWDGLYMFHCHNMVHEDHEMMAAFNVTQLRDLGYRETSFADPMEQRWRAVSANARDYTPQAVQAKIEMMARLQPYNNVEEVEGKLRDYWASRGGSPRNRLKMRRISRIEEDLEANDD